MSDQPPAQGWFCDPFKLHHDRWFSAGKATNLDMAEYGGPMFN